AGGPKPRRAHSGSPWLRASSSWQARFRRALGHQNSYVVTVPGEVAVQNCRNQGGMLIPYPGIMIQIPSGLEPVGVHHQDAVSVPRKREFLNLADMMTDRAIVRGHSPAGHRSNQGRSNVSDPRKAQQSPFKSQEANGHGGTPGLFQGIVTALKNRCRGIVSRLSENPL